MLKKIKIKKKDRKKRKESAEIMEALRPALRRIGPPLYLLRTGGWTGCTVADSPLPFDRKDQQRHLLINWKAFIKRQQNVNESN